MAHPKVTETQEQAKMTTKPRTRQEDDNPKTCPEKGEEELDAEGGAIGGGLPESEVWGTMLLKALSLTQYPMVEPPETVASWNQTFRAFLLHPQLRGARRARRDPTLELRMRSLQPQLGQLEQRPQGAPTPNRTTAPLLVRSRSCHSTPTPDGTTAPHLVTLEKGSLQWRLVLHVLLSTSEKGSHQRQLVLWRFVRSRGQSLHQDKHLQQS